MSLTKQVLAFRRAETWVGDTLQTIAAREMGDASRWPDLAGLNGLQPPWITDDLAVSSPTVLLAGQQQIKIPANAPLPGGVTDRDSVFGCDIALHQGQLQVTSTGDLAVISGAPNLTQALTNRLASRIGDLNYHPDYGCDVAKLIGQGGTETVNSLAVTLVSRAVRSDGRVASVSKATGTIQGDRIAVTVTAVAVDGRRVSVGIPAGRGTPSSV